MSGLLIGFAGIVVLVWPELTFGTAGTHRFLAGVIALQVASLGWSLGSSYSRRLRHDNVLGTTAFQMIAGGLMMVVAGTVRGEWASLFFTTRTTVALLYLSTLGAIGGFVAYTYALRHLPVSFVSLYAYINPVIAVALGVFFLSEPFTPRMALAALLVFLGVAVVRMNTTTSESRHAAPPAAEPALEERRRIA